MRNLFKSFFIKFTATILGTLIVIFAVPINDVSPLAGRIIILDPGHGIGMNLYKGYDEGIRMLEFAEILQPKLEKLGATVYLTRSTLDDVHLVDRVSFVNKLSLEVVKNANYAKLRVIPEEYHHSIYNDIDEINRLIVLMDNIIANNELSTTYYRLPYSTSADRVIHEDLEKIFNFQACDDVESRMLFLSLHTNATPLPIAEELNGVTAFYVDNDVSYNSTYYNNYSFTENNQIFCDMIIDEVANVGFKRLPLELNNFFMNREMNIPSILVENGFHTNDIDRENLLDDLILEQMADAYCSVIINYFNLDIIPDIPVYDLSFFESVKNLVS